MRLSLLLLLLPVICQSQIKNGSFEDWYTDPQGKKRLIGWEHVGKSNEPTPLPGTSMETNSQHLNYAIKISRWYDYTWDKIIQRTAVQLNPAALSGYYKYTDNELTGDRNKDTAYVSIYLTKWDGVQNRTDTLGRGYVELGPAANYQRFECQIVYSAAGVADSMIIEASPSKWDGIATFCANPGYCSFFTVDNLSLKGSGSLPVINTLFPNPTTGRFQIYVDGNEMGVANILNSVGQLVSRRQVSPGTNVFDVWSLQRGVYFVQIITGSSDVRIFKVVKY